nr:sigma 54-interacting transcriptional regulator [Bacillus sp. B15-48]
MNRNKVISGLIIILQDSTSIRKRLNKSSHSQAYYTFDKILGESKVMKTMKQKATDASHSSSSIILTGESGTGKELFAQSIHNESSRRNGPFIAINCATVQPELIASELFGYVDGAFTGAKKGGSMGKFEYADQGTLFLDEVGELPLFAQTMLLRVLEERRVTRVGSNISTPVDVRVISATNRDLKKMVKEGTFRLDLYYRINVIHLHLPPLRERVTDIPILINYYLQYFNRILKKNVTEISSEALCKLVSYSWPGNLRELRNMVECSVNITKNNTLELCDLPLDILNNFEDDGFHDEEIINECKDDFHNGQRKIIIDLMLKYNGNKSFVAKKLGISRNTLYKKLKTYNIS